MANKKSEKILKPTPKGGNMKKRLTQSEEFDIMKLVLDKFLWLGFGVMAYGLYQIILQAYTTGFIYIIIGAVILLLFVAIIVREYEFLK